MTYWGGGGAGGEGDGTGVGGGVVPSTTAARSQHRNQRKRNANALPARDASIEEGSAHGILLGGPNAARIHRSLEPLRQRLNSGTAAVPSTAAFSP